MEGTGAIQHYEGYRSHTIYYSLSVSCVLVGHLNYLYWSATISDNLVYKTESYKRFFTT